MKYKSIAYIKPGLACEVFQETIKDHIFKQIYCFTFIVFLVDLCDFLVLNFVINTPSRKATYFNKTRHVIEAGWWLGRLKLVKKVDDVSVLPCVWPLEPKKLIFSTLDFFYGTVYMIVEI